MLDFLILALNLHVTFGKLLRFLAKLLVGLLQLSLLSLQFRSKLLGLREQRLGLHRRLDRIQHDTDAAGQLLEERDLQVRKAGAGAKLNNGLASASDSNRKDDHALRHYLEQRRADRYGMGRHVGDQEASLIRGALADQPLAES